MFSVLGKLSWFFKDHWVRYSVAITLLIIGSVIEVIPPWIIGEAIDAITTGELTSSTLRTYVILFAAIILGGYITNFIWQYQLFGGSVKIERILRTRLMSKFLHMTPGFYEKNRTGDLMARSTNDLNAVATTAGFGIMTLIDSTLYMLAIILAMGFFISWKLTFFALLPIPILAIIMQYLGKIIHEKYMDAQDAFGNLNDRVLESIAGVRVIRAYVQERRDEQNFADMSNMVFEKNMVVERIDALFGPITKVGTGISYVVALGYGAHLVSIGEMTVGNLVTFNVYLGLAIWPMFAIGELINVMQRGNASLDRVQETLNADVDVPEPQRPTKGMPEPTVGFSRVHFQYPTSKVINLDQIDVRIEVGQTLGIVGKTGAGKTTFVKQLLKEYPMGRGTVEIGDLAIADQTREDVLSRIGYVPQDHVLFSRTIRENILFGKDNASEEDLKQAIHLAYFEKDLNNLPLGLETLVGEKGVSLSGGQKQRVSIARALIKNPDILLLDDSLSAVDAKTESKIIENIQKNRTGKTTIITTHRLSAIQHADHIIVLDDGRIIEQGTHQYLLANGGWYREQFDRQQLEEVKG
ncbi:ABC transporter ATP-binding protein [Chryseomicrobium palamuruense]|uniref:ABC transporter ATP-binding protein n=1 Tax=Chryseomicrobium palamuruense TaxID=682973 RepID=A0ABV8US51_9BACL